MFSLSLPLSLSRSLALSFSFSLYQRTNNFLGQKKRKKRRFCSL
jgi:hypothetical protein